MRAMILAAGRGERMRPLTDKTPKPLLRAGGKPLIVWHIERLVKAGIVDIVINHAWLGDQIEQTLGQGDQFGARLHYSAESTPLETAGGIAKALPFFDDQPFLVINGDVWCDWDPMLAQHCARALIQNDALACLLLVDNPKHHPKGDFNVLLSQGVKSGSLSANYTRVLADTTIEAGQNDVRRLTFSGIGVYQRDLFATVSRETPAPLAPLLRTAIAQSRVIGTYHDGAWTDVGTPERLDSLEQSLARRR